MPWLKPLLGKSGHVDVNSGLHCNVGATVRQLKINNQLLKWQTDIKVAELNGTLKKIVCGNCNKEFKTVDGWQLKCPHCKAVLQEKKPE